VLVLIGVRFCHKTIIAVAAEMLQVSESERFPVQIRKFHRIVTGLHEALLFYGRLTSRYADFWGFLAGSGVGC
jgi:hypothetical protein